MLMPNPIAREEENQMLRGVYGMQSLLARRHSLRILVAEANGPASKAKT